MKTPILTLAVLTGLALTSCSRNEQLTTLERTVAVRAEVVRISTEDMVKTFTGSIEGERQAVLYAKLAEAVDKVHVREGQTVQTDQVIISLDKLGPSSRYNETISLYQNAEKNFAKMEYLFKEGAISESEFDQAKTGYEVARANFDAVKRLVDITSPIEGTVTSIPVSPGDFVQVGQKVATVATIRNLRIKFGVNADDIRFISVGADVTVISDALSQTGHGKVVSVAESADPFSRAFQVEALIDNQERLFKPGMFVKVNIVQKRLEHVIAIPRVAVVTLDDRTVAFTVQNGTARRQDVVLGEDLDGRVVVTSGLTAGDTLVTLGQTYLEDGFKVTVAAAGDEGK
ncbi:MAG: efflux RND transporter periplasmic adaptor subunit [Candidatus Zixiibacteriota bacterium]